MMKICTLWKAAAASLLVAVSACGGASDDTVTPVGPPLPDVRFADSSGYYPLDKLRPDGTYFEVTDADYGTRNPAAASGDRRQSPWAIDASATVPSTYTLTYSMTVEGVDLPTTAVMRMTSNLRINNKTGLITQFCTGYPSCYDNTSDIDERFRISVTAQVDGETGVLKRSFQLVVRAND